MEQDAKTKAADHQEVPSVLPPTGTPQSGCVLDQAGALRKENKRISYPLSLGLQYSEGILEAADLLGVDLFLHLADLHGIFLLE